MFDIVDILDIAVVGQKNAEYQKFRENKNKITVTHRALPDCFQNLEMYLSLGLIEN